MKHSLTHGAGYLVIDHSDSPGVSPADVAHVPGALAVSGGKKLEADVLTCAHCERAILLNPERARPRNHCQKCDHYICDSPSCNVGCSPFKRVLDQAQAIAEKFIGDPHNPALNVLCTDDLSALRQETPRIVLTDAP